VQADSCGLRALESVNAPEVADRATQLASTLSRGVALELLTNVFMWGLGSTPASRSRWSRDGYLFPSLRILAVRRQFSAMENRLEDPHIGPCGESLRSLWESANDSRLCVSSSHVLLMPVHGVPFSIFPEKQIEGVYGAGPHYCLDATTDLPKVALSNDHPVKLRVLTIRNDSPHFFIPGSEAETMISRLPLQASLAACLGDHRGARITIHFDEHGKVDWVKSSIEGLSACFKKALSDVSMGLSMPTPAPISPGTDVGTGAYSVTIQISR